MLILSRVHKLSNQEGTEGEAHRERVSDETNRNQRAGGVE